MHAKADYSSTGRDLRCGPAAYLAECLNRRFLRIALCIRWIAGIGLALCYNCVNTLSAFERISGLRRSVSRMCETCGEESDIPPPSGNGPMSAKQRDYLVSLARRFGVNFDDELTKAEAAHAISYLKPKLRKRWRKFSKAEEERSSY
ncbi:MAG: DUF3072 domain-containing protein [Rhodomicrobium sp.]